MNLGEIYTYINAMIAKSIEGNAFSPKTFDPTLKEVNIEMFKEEWDLLERQAKSKGKKIYDLLFSGSPLRSFTVTGSGLTVSSGGLIQLSAMSGFEQFITGVALNKGVYRELTLVDIPEANYRKTHVDGTVLEEAPIISLYSTYLKVLPTNIGNDANSVEIIYLRMPVTPNFDYYVKESTGKVSYFLPGYKAIKSGSNYYIVNQYDVTVETGVQVPNNVTAATPYTSASVELEWKESYHGDFINRLLKKAGVPIRDAFIEQTTK